MISWIARGFLEIDPQTPSRIASSTSTFPFMPLVLLAKQLAYNSGVSLKISKNH